MINVNLWMVIIAIVAFFIGKLMYWQGSNGRGRSRNYWQWKEQALMNGLKYMLWWIVIWSVFHYGFIPFIWDHLKFA